MLFFVSIFYREEQNLWLGVIRQQQQKNENIL